MLCIEEFHALLQDMHWSLTRVPDEINYLEMKMYQIERKLDEIKSTKWTYHWKRFGKRATFCKFLFAPLDVFESQAKQIVITKVYEGRVHKIFLREHELFHDGDRYRYECANARRTLFWQPLINEPGKIEIEYKCGI